MKSLSELKEANARRFCESVIVALVGDKLAPVWWNGVNRAFADKTPNQQWNDDWVVVLEYVKKHYDYSY